MTDLEKILSNLAHIPVALVDFNSKISCGSGLAPEYHYEFTAVPNPKLDGDDLIPFCDEDCANCEICGNTCNECGFDEEPMCWGIPDVEYIIFNPPATIVFWSDGTKTVVKAMEGEKYEKYAGFAMACMKKMFGSTSRAKAIMADCDEDNLKAMFEESKPKPEPKKTENKPKSIGIEQLVDAFVSAVKQVAGKQEGANETPAE